MHAEQNACLHVKERGFDMLWRQIAHPTEAQNNNSLTDLQFEHSYLQLTERKFKEENHVLECASLN